MEFVLVLPIYLALMGAVFCLGELGIKTIFLAQGDRAEAHSVDGGSIVDAMAGGLFRSNGAGPMMGGDRYLVASMRKGYRADESFEGAWGWQCAGTLPERYSAPHWVRAWFGHVHDKWSATTGDAAGLGFGAVRDFLSSGWSLLTSKDRDTQMRTYNYYTLKRTSFARNGSTYRHWSEKNLAAGSFWPVLGSHWYRHVYGEPFMDASGARLDDAPGQGLDGMPDEPKGRGDFHRFFLMVDWSQ